MNSVLTIKDLYEIVKEEMRKGNSDKKIMISNDDEGNGYHYLFYGFTSGNDMSDDDMFVMSVDDELPFDDIIVLG